MLDDYATATPRVLVADTKYAGAQGTVLAPRLPRVKRDDLYQVLTAVAVHDADLGVIVQPMPEQFPINQVGLEELLVPARATAFKRDLSIRVVRVDLRFVSESGPLAALADQLELSVASELKKQPDTIDER